MQVKNRTLRELASLIKRTIVLNLRSQDKELVFSLLSLWL